MEVSVGGFTDDKAAIIRFLLYPYDVTLTSEMDAADVVICRDSSDFSKPTIVVPTSPDWGGEYQEPRTHGNGIIDLPFDLINMCSRRFEAVMDPKPALLYRLFTRLPFAHSIVRPSMRNRLLRMQALDSSLSNHISTEVARKTLIKAFDLLGFQVKRRSPPLFLVTHDVDSEKGLRRAISLKEVDNELGVPCIWFLPSDEYVVPRHIARELGDGSQIGSHDVKHDGRLIHIRRHNELVKRLRESRSKLERIFEREIISFRSPLLQFSRGIVTALHEAGYKSDFSLACWEPVHPSTMRGFGVELLQPFEIEGVVEFPLTMFQDHQVLDVMGMSIHDAIRFWIEQAKLIRAFDGDIVLLVHPDYGFSRDIRGYRELLECLREIHSKEIDSDSWA